MIPIEQYLNDMLTGILKIAYVDLVTSRNSFNSGFSIDFLMSLSRPFLSVPQAKFQVYRLVSVSIYERTKDIKRNFLDVSAGKESIKAFRWV